MAYVEALKEVNSEELDDSDVDNEEEEDLAETPKAFEFKVNSGVVSSPQIPKESVHDWDYERTMQKEFEYEYEAKEVNLARPHKYCAMVMVCLSGKIGDQGYSMLVDLGSKLNIITLEQAQELALPIDDIGNSWMLKGISGHTMGLEGICWNIPAQIGGIEFCHNFFVT